MVKTLFSKTRIIRKHIFFFNIESKIVRSFVCFEWYLGVWVELRTPPQKIRTQILFFLCLSLKTTKGRAIYLRVYWVLVGGSKIGSKAGFAPVNKNRMPVYDMKNLHFMGKNRPDFGSFSQF